MAGGEVLELGCGTGRVTVPLSQHCAYIHGLEISEAMLRRCEAKLAAAHIPKSRATVELAGVTKHSLGRRFDRVIAPFRMLQNLVEDSAVRGFFERMAEHLEEGGVGIVSAFNPNRAREDLIALWSVPGVDLQWETRDGSDTVQCFMRRSRITTEPLVLYPELIYRRIRAAALVDEAVLEIPMRCYYPEELLRLIERHGFKIVDAWGGYAGEPYGSGGELVVAMRHGA